MPKPELLTLLRQPQFAVITDGKTSDIVVTRQQRFEAGTMLVFDRGYQDFN